MNDLKMGFKHSMMQRLQHYNDMYPLKASAATSPLLNYAAPTTPSSMPNSPTGRATNAPTATATIHVTDFSINRILSDPKPSKTPRRTGNPAGSASSAFILDLSKSASTNLSDVNVPSSPPAASLHGYPPNYYGLHPDFVAVANATKFYAQFFPHIFPAYSQTPTASPYQKRYFAPYIVNSNGGGNGAASTRLQPTAAAAPSLQNLQLPPPMRSNSNDLSPTAASLPSTVGGKMSCPRIDCIDCLDYYKHYSYKSQRFSTSSPMSACTTSSGYSSAKSKSSAAEIHLNASTISLTAVTNLNITAKSSSSGVAVGGPVLISNNGLSVNTSEEISYKCRICDKVFGCDKVLQAHEKTHKSPRYECSDCGKGFSQLRNYKYHLSVHRGTKEFAAECPECGKTFNDKGYLSSHMKIHRNKKEYECPYCPKSFNQRVAFNMHVRIHTGVKPHKCTECGKRFSRKMLLKQHMRTHSGEKPYQCSVCGKSFADRSNMTLHHRLHSGIKPFSCPICPKAFTKKHHLKTHLNYHTGCKPYVCPHPNCNQAFTQSSNMRTHAKKCQFRPLQLQFPAVSSSATLPNASAITMISTTPSTTTTMDLSRMSSSTSSPISASASLTSSMAMQKMHNSFGIRMLTGHASSASTATSVSASTPALATTLQSSVFPNPHQQQALLSTMRPF